MHKLMIIEDTDTIRVELTRLLERYGYEVVAPTDFTHILEIVKEEKPSLILLDINLPIFDGFYFCRQIRQSSSIPIMIVTSRDSDMDELMGMNLGADDFVTKPYNAQILLARIAALLNRAYPNQMIGNILSHRDLQLDLAKGMIEAYGQSSELSKNELKILSYLLQHKEAIVSREELMQYMWNSDVFVDDNTLSVNVNRLRKKLEELGLSGYIETRRGLGYRLL